MRSLVTESQLKNYSFLLSFARIVIVLKLMFHHKYVKRKALLTAIKLFSAFGCNITAILTSSKLYRIFVNVTSQITAHASLQSIYQLNTGCLEGYVRIPSGMYRRLMTYKCRFCVSSQQPTVFSHLWWHWNNKIIFRF